MSAAPCITVSNDTLDLLRDWAQSHGDNVR